MRETSAATDVIIDRTYADHHVNVRLTSHGMYQVAVDRWLVGCYEDEETAKFEAAEKIRQLIGWPEIPVITLDAVEKYSKVTGGAE